MHGVAYCHARTVLSRPGYGPSSGGLRRRASSMRMASSWADPLRLSVPWVASQRASLRSSTSAKSDAVSRSPFMQACLNASSIASSSRRRCVRLSRSSRSGGNRAGPRDLTALMKVGILTSVGLRLDMPNGGYHRIAIVTGDVSRPVLSSGRSISIHDKCPPLPAPVSRKIAVPPACPVRRYGRPSVLRRSCPQ